MPTETLLTSHYPVSRGDEVGEFLGESRAFADRLDAAVSEELQAAGEPRTTRQLVESLAPRLGSWPAPARALLVFPLVRPLEQPARRGRVAPRREGDVVAWRWRD